MKRLVLPALSGLGIALVALSVTTPAAASATVPAPPQFPWGTPKCNQLYCPGSGCGTSGCAGPALPNQGCRQKGVEMWCDGPSWEWICWEVNCEK